jgi:hypothetical protein
MERRLGPGPICRKPNGPCTRLRLPDVSRSPETAGQFATSEAFAIVRSPARCGAIPFDSSLRRCNRNELIGERRRLCSAGSFRPASTDAAKSLGSGTSAPGVGTDEGPRPGGPPSPPITSCCLNGRRGGRTPPQGSLWIRKPRNSLREEREARHFRHGRQEPQIAKSRHFARGISMAESAQFALVL